ncbi:gag-pol polyprotein [Cucumis melo var. makuwa]|uniref:Gag-pol polyprotein n=1 Tax=Cucumis melo var. makuwa TaxID=1194695 RepID=A0A5A7TET5_CUCMM|nr:gag-pol polyprotein [Cucumis melo var. makuwa]TYK06305.1 gag-pol polyprotein [Cucumis melo var. makuwa]
MSQLPLVALKGRFYASSCKYDEWKWLRLKRKSGLKDHGDNQKKTICISYSCLDGKSYSYWKPQMIFFIKMLDGKAWRALVAGYDPLMIILNGVSVPKLEVDWIDAKEQAFVGNARALNVISNGVDLNVFKLINSCSTVKGA